MALSVGDFVSHPTRPEWGDGEVLAIEGSHIRLFFSEVGEKTVDERYVRLTVLNSGRVSQRRPTQVLPHMDMERIRTLCKLFVAELKDNRSTYNDASLAEHVMDDLARLGRLSRTTARQLAAWCTTNGSVFQVGVPIAQDVSRAIYGRVLRRQDVEELE